MCISKFCVQFTSLCGKPASNCPIVNISGGFAVKLDEICSDCFCQKVSISLRDSLADGETEFTNDNKNYP